MKKNLDQQHALAREHEIQEEKNARALKHAHDEAIHEEREQRRKAAEQAEKDKAAAIAAAKDKKQTMLIIVGVLVFSLACGIVGVLVAAPSMTAQSSETPQPEPTPTPQATPTPTHVDRTPPYMHSATPPHRH